MNFQNLYDFAQIWRRHSLIHFLSKYAKKIGGHHVGFQDGADQSSLDYMHIFAQVFSINSASWKAINVWVCSNIWAKHCHCARNDFESFLALAIVLQVEIARSALTKHNFFRRSKLKNL